MRKENFNVSKKYSSKGIVVVIRANSCFNIVCFFISILKLLAQEHFRDISGLVATLKVLSEPANFDAHQDVTLVLNLLNGVDGKQGSKPFNGEVLALVISVTNSFHCRVQHCCWNTWCNMVIVAEKLLLNEQCCSLL